jgi:cell division protein FtsL
MLRALAIAAIVLALACAFALYSVNYDTRKLEARVQADERLADALADDIAVLKAERAFLSRPERIERAARKLGLEPARGQQFVRLGEAERGRGQPSDASAQATGP